MSRRKILAAKLAAAALMAIVLFAALCNWRVEAAAQGRIFMDPNLIPSEKVGIVLGTMPVVNHRLNTYYQERMVAAARLYHSGKVSYLIVSGDPWQPAVMRSSLVALGVPASRITLDAGGHRTLASILRARDTFGLRSFVVISQPDHCARAIYLGRAFGCDVEGFAAADPRKAAGILREFFARPKAVLDVYLLHRNDAAEGPRIPIQGAEEDAANKEK